MKQASIAAAVGLAIALSSGTALAGKDLDAINARGPDFTVIENVEEIRAATPGMGKALGIDEKWVYNIVTQVGNYDEGYDRHVGPNSLLKIDRDVNRLWTQGDIQSAPPIR